MTRKHYEMASTCIRSGKVDTLNGKVIVGAVKAAKREVALTRFRRHHSVLRTADLEKTIVRPILHNRRARRETSCKKNFFTV